MSPTTQEQAEAQVRRAAVKMYRTGISAMAAAQKFHRSRSWLYKWVQYREHHPWTRFPSTSRAPHHHPNALPASSERRIIRLRQQLVRPPRPRLRFAPIGARSIQHEWPNRYGLLPSLSTIQRVLGRHQLTTHPARKLRAVYGPIQQPRIQMPCMRPTSSPIGSPGAR